MKLKHTLLLGLLCCVGCIENDIPYPIRKGLITEIEFVGQKSVEIDKEKYIVNLVLEETADIQNIEMIRFHTTENTSVSTAIETLPVTINFEKDYNLTLTTYQDYKWTIKATQPIDRSATSVEGQVGKAIFDDVNRSVVIYVADDADFKAINVNNIIFASPVNSTVSPDPATVHDFSDPVQFHVIQHGRTVEWTVNILPSYLSLETGQPAEVWAKRAVLTGNVKMEEGVEVGFEYRKATDKEYHKTTDVTVEGGSISATIVTEPGTGYVYRIFKGTNTGAYVAFETDDAPEIPNLSFNDWHQDDKTWYPCKESEFVKKDDPDYKGFWNTGNSGVTLFKDSNVSPVDDPKATDGKAVQLKTVNIAIVKLAAGSLFVGNFITDILKPLTSPRFGCPFTGRPTMLKGKYKYFPKTIDVSNTKDPEIKKYLGQSDRCIIWVTLEDWKGATVRPKDPVTIARAEMREMGTVSEYKEFTLTFDYKDKQAKPTHICMVVSCSEFGDFYTGGIDTEMYVDD
ncbi:MAG: PCMD domain-containing protein, partial [Rikenellaceae bacterium]